MHYLLSKIPAALCPPFFFPAAAVAQKNTCACFVHYQHKVPVRRLCLVFFSKNTMTYCPKRFYMIVIALIPKTNYKVKIFPPLFKTLGHTYYVNKYDCLNQVNVSDLK